jgi:hypothetical protein
MIWQPKVGQVVTVNYKDKTMYYQNYLGYVCAVGNGRGPKNVLVEIPFIENEEMVVVPRGNLNAI